MYIHKHFSANNLSYEPFPFLRELAMEAYILENENVLSLESAGYEEVAIVDSEVHIPELDSSKNGRIDILAKYGQDYIAIVELKMGKLSLDHLKQLEGYLNKKDKILQKNPQLWDKTISKEPQWIGILVGEKIDRELMLKITENAGYSYNNQIPIAALAINRFRGQDGNVYVVTDTYFVTKSKGKDMAKYKFNESEYGKGRLVLAVMKYYIQAKPNIKYVDLKAVFPDDLQGRDEVFTSATKANNIFQTTGRKRHFINPDDLIKIDKEIIAVSNQWGKGNIEDFIKHCRSIKDVKLDIKKVTNK